MKVLAVGNNRFCLCLLPPLGFHPLDKRDSDLQSGNFRLQFSKHAVSRSHGAGSQSGSGLASPCDETAVIPTITLRSMTRLFARGKSKILELMAFERPLPDSDSTATSKSTQSRGPQWPQSLSPRRSLVSSDGLSLNQTR